MHSLHHARPRLAARHLLCVGALLAGLAFLVGGPGSDDASAVCRGSGCLPASGYTLDTVWNCGEITTSTCWANGTKNGERAVAHTFGWASASNSSAGTTQVCVGIAWAGSCGTNLARICMEDSCIDQDAIPYSANVENVGGGSYNISGHAKA